MAEIKENIKEKDLKEMVNCVSKQVIGRKNEIIMIISALRAGKHIFLEGPPGTSKSTIIQAISSCADIGYLLITGNSDLSTSKLVGFFDPAQTLAKGYTSENFNPGPLVEAMKKGALLYVEEFNRLPDETTNIFVTVMSEKKLTIPRLGVIETHPDFRIIAALNPLDDIGISRISRALKDRFTSIRLDYQSKEEEMEIVKLRCPDASQDIIEFAVDIARETRHHPDLKLGSSVRGSIDMVDIYLQSANLLSQEEDQETLLLNSAIMAFRNKIWIYETSERTPESIITEIFNRLQRAKKKARLRSDFPFDQGTLTEMAAAESQLLLPIQERIAALIEQGDLEAVYSISQEYVKTVGDMLNDYPLALAQWEETNPELLQKLLIRTWNRLDQDMQKRFLHIMLNLINRVSHSELLKEGITTGEVKSEPFDFEGDEIDLDRTIEEIIQNPVPSYENIYVIERKKRHKSVVIIMDASGSVQDEKLAMAAVAVASIATNLEGRDEYGVVLFSERVNILKRIDQQKPLDEIIRQVLEIVPEGRTDIGAGLLAGLNEINRATSEQKMAILLTDGQQNMGHDPLALARRFPQLHVINLPGGKEDFSQKIAKCAKGEFIKVNNMLDVPKAILKCLS